MAKENTTWAVIGTIPILGFILALVAQKKDKFVMYYAKQGLVLGLAAIVLNVILFVLIITIPLLFILHIATIVLWIISVVNATSGKMKPTPLIGKLAGKINL